MFDLVIIGLSVGVALTGCRAAGCARSNGAAIAWLAVTFTICFGIAMVYDALG